MKSHWNEPDRLELAERTRAVGPASQGLWGTMTAHQMICHVADAYAGVMGEIQLAPRAAGLERPVKWLALYVPVPWPHGYPAPREIDQVRGAGTPPDLFDRDLERALQAMDRFRPEVVRDRPHPLWGRLSVWEWGRWGYLHTDHHLRQFGA